MLIDYFRKKKSLRQQEQELEKEESNWKKEKELIQRREKLREEKNSFKHSKKLTTTKLLILFLFINCTIIEIFTGWATAKSLSIAYITGNPVDFSPLVTLIGAVVSEVMGFAVYSAKAAKENSVNGITYLMAQQSLNNDSDDTACG